jgi:signal transduction histidine kinase
MGIGLAIVTAAVQRHDGSLRIKSTPGIGTEVTLELPPSRVRQNAID